MVFGLGFAQKANQCLQDNVIKTGKIVPCDSTPIVRPNFRTVADPTAAKAQKTAECRNRRRFVVQKVAPLPTGISY